MNFGRKSALREAVLDYFVANRTATVYVRQLAGLLHLDPTNLSRELARLQAQGLLQSEQRGHEKYFSVQRNSRTAKDWLKVLEKSYGIVPRLTSGLKLVPGLHQAWLVGSFAKGSAAPTSDIDLLLVGEPDTLTLAAAFARIERTLQREINYTILSDAELENKLKHSDPFITDLWNGQRVPLKTA